MRDIVRRWNVVLIMVLLLVLPLLSGGMVRGENRPRAGEEAADTATSAAEAPDEDDGSAAIHPDAISSFRTRTYQIKPRKLWVHLMRSLEEVGYPPEEVDEKEMRVKTSFIDFGSKDYSEEVAEAPPRLTPDYQVLQMKKVRAGKVSLEAVVASEKSGAALSLRARILVQGLDRRTGILIYADRRSSGVIEADFLRWLEDELKLKRL